MNPRGVTLVELLAAISILVVVTALSLPAVQGRLAGARMEAAQGQIEAAVLATRAEAVRAGKPLVLLARAGAKGEIELVVASLEEGSSPLENVGATQPAPEGRERPRARGSVWCVLPGGVRITDRPVEIGGVEPASPALPRSPQDADRVEGDSDVRIAVFCPDGTALATAASFLTDSSVVLAIGVNEWVGGVRFAPYVPPAEGGEGDEKPAGSDAPAPASSEASR